MLETTNEKLYTFLEAAKLTGISATTLRKANADNNLEAVRTDGVWYIPESELRIYLRKHAPEGLAFGEIQLKPKEVLKPISSYHIDIFDSFCFEFAHSYVASNLGRIFNLDSAEELTPFHKNDDNPRLFVGLAKRSIDGIVPKHFQVSRLVAYAFCPKRPDRDECHHINGDPSDNRSCNLIWCTRKEHLELHKLLKSDKAEYRRKLKEIKKDNAKWQY